jgi:SAM-dependent methyltransferase
LIKGAKLLAEKEGAAEPLNFVCADAIAYVKNLPDKSIDGVITERFLINMPDEGVQRAIIRDIHRVLRPGGRFMMCEGSMEGFRGLNDLRSAVGLDPILERSADNPAAIRFEDKEIERFVTEEAGFRLLGKFGMSLYFTVSRVLHPLLAAPRPPKFDAPINDLAGLLQSKLTLDPGIGSNVVWLLERA